MLTAAAVCPHPPLLVPEVGVGLAPDIAEVRGAAVDAVHALLATDPDIVVVVGDAPQRREYAGSGSFAAYGVDRLVRLGEPGEDTDLPLSLLVGGWLLEHTALGELAVRAFGIPPLPVQECADFGSRLARLAPRVAMLAMGDGSARRSTAAPGYLDERAAGYDEKVAVALAAVDTAALLGLDPALSAELLVAGRASWQVLAGAAEATGPTRAIGGPWTGELLAQASPYGVAYPVASWRRQSPLPLLTR